MADVLLQTFGAQVDALSSAASSLAVLESSGLEQLTGSAATIRHMQHLISQLRTTGLVADQLAGLGSWCCDLSRIN